MTPLATRTLASPFRQCATIALSTAIMLWTMVPCVTAAPGSAVLVDSFETAPEVAVAGETFELTLLLRNHTTRRADDVQVTIGTAAAADSSAAETIATTDLAVIGTGNTKRVGRIPAESTATATFTLAADPAARAGLHSLPVTITYETGGRQEQLTQSIGVWVTRLATLDATAFELPGEAVAGESFEALAEVMNTGDVRAAGVALSLTVTGASSEILEGGRQVVGMLDSGDLDVVEATVTAAEPGEVEIVLAIAYADALGTTHEITHTESVTVTEAEEDEAAIEETERDRGFFGTIADFFRAIFGLGK